MQTYELLVKEKSVRPNSKDMTLVRTSIGIDQVHILFDNVEWLGFPITVTFAQGDDVITIPITVTELHDSEWVAEATVTVPYEVIDMVAIRVTLQGTDAQGNHIITAKGSPLWVEEAGDVIEGLAPADAPTISEWQQAYSDAQVAISQAQSLVNDLTNRLDEVVQEAIQRISHEQYELPVATDEVLGGVKIGSGIGRRDDGTIFVTQQESQSQPSQLNARLLARIAEIVDATITATYDDDGISGTSVSHESLPVATMDTLGAVYPDGTSVVIDDDGMIHAEAAYIPIATIESTGSVKPDGTTITIDEDGTIHGSMSYELPAATTETLGGVRPDGQSITVDQDGTIHGAGGSGVTYVDFMSPSESASSGKYYCYNSTTIPDFTLEKGAALVIMLIATPANATGDVYIKINDGDLKRIALYSGLNYKWSNVPLGVPMLIVYDGNKWVMVGETDNPSNRVFSCVSTTAASANPKAVDVNVPRIVTGMTVILTLTNANTVSLQYLQLQVNCSMMRPFANIRKNGEVLTETDNLKANVPYVLQYDGTYWELIGAINDSVLPSDTAPAMDGTVSAGSSTDYARADHVHPTDTSRLAASLKGVANGVAELDSTGKVPSSQLPSYVGEMPIATTESLGCVIPDGTSITIDQDGTIHAVGATSADETDPTVPSWAKQPSKPTYTAQEVGALPNTTVIPSKTSQLTNDSGFVTSVPTKTSQLTNDSGFITNVPIATSSVTGKVKPDGSTITIDSDGTIHAASEMAGPHWETRVIDGRQRLVIVIPEEG